jgi:hypothetical protein
MADDMAAGAEAYLQMWERAVGIESKRCFFHQDGITRRGRGPLRLGDGWRTVLRRAGQPQQRDRAWSWCVKGRGNSRAADVAVLDPEGRVELVGTTARGRRTRGLMVGDRTSRKGLFTRRSGTRTFVYSAAGGRVRAIAVTSTKLARNRRALRVAMRRLTRARATAARRTFVPAKAQASGRMLGRTLAGSADREENARQALLCNLNL